MTKEELEQEAENFVYGMGYDTYESDGHSDFAVQDILVKFAEPREKRIVDLEAQTEKMKCCGNCQKLRGRFDSKTNINILYCSDSDMKQIEVGFQMCCCKWEIKEE